MTKAVQQLEHCPTPHKRHHAGSLALAQLVADVLTVSRGRRFEAYQCRCNFWHVRDRTRRHARAQELKKARRRAARPLETVMMIAEHAEWLP